MILVTGASGRIGRELVGRLSAAEVGFRGGYRDLAKAPEHRGLEPVALDYNTLDSVRAALTGVDKLFLLASGADQPRQESALVEEALRAGVKHIVKLSAWSADKEAYAFARLHRSVEKRIEGMGIPFTFLRPTGFMQNVLGLAATLKAQGAFCQPAPTARWSPIDVRDIAAVAARVLTSSGHEGKRYELSGPEALTQAQQAERLATAIGKPVKYLPVSSADYKKTLLGFGVPEATANGLIDLFEYYTRPEAATVTHEVERLTGRAPLRFDQFARDFAAAFK
jgi:uncharacterized protein YbjT (DUF2867 family)